MEPGFSRDSSAGSGCPKSAGVREETPGEEAKGGDVCTAVMKRREDGPAAEEAKAESEEEGGDAQNQIKNISQDEGKYEEELDPRIQA